MKPEVNCRHCKTPLAGEQYGAVIQGRCTQCFRGSYPNSSGRWCPGCGDVLNSWHPDDGMCESCHGAGIKKMIRPNANQVKHGWWQLGQIDGWNPHKSKSSSDSSSKSSGGCFITTSTLSSLGSIDDKHPILQKLRGFRDKFILSLPNGVSLVEEYYCVAPEIVEAIDKLPDSTSQYSDIYSTYINKCVKFIDEGHKTEAFQLYKVMVEDLRIKYLETNNLKNDESSILIKKL